jgi:hypothetical protein
MARLTLTDRLFNAAVFAATAAFGVAVAWATLWLISL